jgi:hypothetical protein
MVVIIFDFVPIFRLSDYVECGLNGAMQCTLVGCNLPYAVHVHL